MRIQEELKRCSASQVRSSLCGKGPWLILSKLVWFLAPSVALCYQQHQYLERYLPAYQILFLSGNDNIDKWTEGKLWDGVLKNVNVVVSTPQVLLDALTHGFVKMAKLALLIYDEGK